MIYPIPMERHNSVGPIIGKAIFKVAWDVRYKGLLHISVFDNPDGDTNTSELLVGTEESGDHSCVRLAEVSGFPRDITLPDYWVDQTVDNDRGFGVNGLDSYLTIRNALLDKPGEAYFVMDVVIPSDLTVQNYSVYLSAIIKQIEGTVPDIYCLVNIKDTGYRWRRIDKIHMSESQELIEQLVPPESGITKFVPYLILEVY